MFMFICLCGIQSTMKYKVGEFCWNCYDLTSMTWKEVKESFKTVQMAIIPIGAHEQHGPHMVESCDAVLLKKWLGS